VQDLVQESGKKLLIDLVQEETEGYCSHPRVTFESYILSLVKCMAEARMQTGRKWLWIASVVVLIAVFFVARYFLRERLPVRTVQVQHAALQYTVSTNGRVEPIVNYQFYSPLATTVEAVYAQVGDQVPAGKLLITLDDLQARAQVASAESAVKTAQATLYAATHNGTQAEQQASAAEIEQDRLARDQVKRNLDALMQLASTGAAAPGEVTAAHERLQAAEATLAAAQKNALGRYSTLDVARAQAALADAQAALAAAQHVEAQTSYRAPITGTVYTMDAAASQYAEAGKLLVEMADMHRERVRAYPDEPDLGHLAVGQKVAIHWDAKPASEWHGHISRLPASVVAYTTRNVGEVLIDFDGPSDGLLPATNVTVTVTISSDANALSMPREALHEQNGQYYVFKVEHGQLKRVAVKVGSPNLTMVPILSGLADGDTVASGTTNGQPLQEGIPIKEEQ
jgi:HlyD family secretion protein